MFKIMTLAALAGLLSMAPAVANTLTLEDRAATSSMRSPTSPPAPTGMTGRACAALSPIR